MLERLEPENVGVKKKGGFEGWITINILRIYTRKLLLVPANSDEKKKIRTIQNTESKRVQDKCQREFV